MSLVDIMRVLYHQILTAPSAPSVKEAVSTNPVGYVL
jgi:hypothetical protein